MPSALAAALGACFVDQGPMQGADSGSTGTTAVTDSAGPTGGATEASTCSDLALELPSVAPSVMLVLDKSGSMVKEGVGFWDHDLDPNTPDVTRWNSLFTVVDVTTQQYQAALDLGAVLFPAITATGDYNASACIVDAAPATPLAAMNAAQLVAALPGPLTDATMMLGGTPTTRGIEVAIAALAGAAGPRFIVLVTDGAANCQADAPDLLALFEAYDEALPGTVAAAAAMGITTHVVGIAISPLTSDDKTDGAPNSTNTQDRLNEVAIAGGAARPGAEKFHNAGDQGALQAALDTIMGEILDCTIELSPPPQDPMRVEVAPYGPTQVVDCGSEDGWSLVPGVGGEPPRIELCGQACADYRSSGKVSLQYRCPD